MAEKEKAILYAEIGEIPEAIAVVSSLPKVKDQPEIIRLMEAGDLGDAKELLGI